MNETCWELFVVKSEFVPRCCSHLEFKMGVCDHMTHSNIEQCTNHMLITAACACCRCDLWVSLLCPLHTKAVQLAFRLQRDVLRDRTRRVRIADCCCRCLRVCATRTLTQHPLHTETRCWRAIQALPTQKSAIDRYPCPSLAS